MCRQLRLISSSPRHPALSGLSRGQSVRHRRGREVHLLDEGAESGKPVPIGRANLDGTAVNKRFITGVTNGPCGIAVVGGHIYWTNAVPDAYQHRFNLVPQQQCQPTGRPPRT
jgi:hypothetical protein